MGKIAQIVIIGLLAVHCSNGSRQDYSAQPAPTKEADLGFIVTAQPEELAAIRKNEPQAGIRALSATNSMYEINHIEASALSAHLSNKNLQKNFFMQGTKNKVPRWNWNFKAANTSPDALSALETCQRTDKAPSVEIDAARSTIKPTIALGESITLAAKGAANKDIGGEVRFLWDMLPPEFSKQGFAKGISDLQTVTPDSVGLYQIALIAQGADSSCGAIIVNVMVTANPEMNSDLQFDGTPDTSLFKHLDDIKARDAWAHSRGAGIVVAVVDSGLDYNHPSIRDRVVVKTPDQEAADGNEFSGDTIGWDFANGDNRPFDDAGHGSHVAGLIASSLAGVAPDAKIIPVKVLNAAGSGDFGSIVAGIFYAANSGAQVINVSLGLGIPFTPPPLVAAFQAAHDKGIVVTVAAGNGDEMTGLGFDIGIRPFQPASLQMDNTITVAATGEGSLTSYSNFSESLVHLAAPGGNENVPLLSLSTMNPQNLVLAAQMGTSMASPVTAGVAALLLSANPKLTAAQVKTILMETGDTLPTLAGKTVSGRQVNALSAIQAALDLNPVSTMN